jgi:aspartyl-tRNA(Asn)/glutamyl-tRNA(Gln) amidotransferase subunit A
VNAELPATISTAAAALRSGAVSSVELTEAVLARADELDAVLGAFVTRFDDTAREAAAQADTDFAAGVDRGMLQGIPLGVKDILAAREGRTTACSRILDPDWGRGRDAPAVARLREQGAVITGKTATMEFAMGPPDLDQPFPQHRNPWDVGRWPGGSSAGTGTAVAAGLVLGGLGTDTGGSIRIPAALCGISGLKPTFGRVPKSGCVPLGFSLDTVGPMARTARDCALVLQAIAGYDASDPCAVEEPVPDYVAALSGDLAGTRVAVERDHHTRLDGVEPSCVARFDAAVDVLADHGADVVEVSLDWYALLTVAGSVTVAGEAFAYHRDDLRARWNEYGRGARRALAMGAFYDAGDFVQAQRVRAFGVAQARRLFERVDVLVTPTIGLGAPRLDSDFWAMMAWTFTPAWNALGLPAMSVPMGFSDERLPLGLQVIGPAFGEAEVLRVADAYQLHTDWHEQHPDPSTATVSTGPRQRG